MPQDLFTIQKSVVELSSLLVGGKINKVIQPTQDQVVLTVFNGKVYNLIISSEAKYCRIGLTFKEKQAPLTAPNFCMLLRKYLLGGQITSITPFKMDRIVKISIENKNDFKDDNVYEIYAEIMGKYSNIFLTSNGVILGSLKNSPQLLDGKRLIMVGSKYSPPTPQDKTDIFDRKKSISVLEKFGGYNLDKFILNNFSLFSPTTALEISYRINKNLNNTKFNATDAYNIIIDFISQQPKGVKITNGKNCDVYVADYAHLDGERDYSSLLTELQALFYDEIEENKLFEDRKNSLLTKINTKEKREIKKLNECEEIEREFLLADKYRLYGELLTANLYAIKKGQEKATLQNYYDKDYSLIDIPLDVNLTPQENAQKYFKKYAKQKRAYNVSVEQKAEILNELEYLSGVKNEINLATSILELNDVIDELILQGIIKDLSPKKKKSKIKKHDAFTTYKIDGFIVKMGKNNLQNDELLQVSERLDIWLHTKNYHSSFVIIETKGKDVPDSVILTSAEICASHSGAKNGSKIEVDYTFKKFVKKPPKSKPGGVIYTNYKTIIVNPNPHENLIVK